MSEARTTLSGVVTAAPRRRGPVWVTFPVIVNPRTTGGSEHPFQINVIAANVGLARSCLDALQVPARVMVYGRLGVDPDTDDLVVYADLVAEDLRTYVREGDTAA